jgi:thymidylate kinase
VPVWAVQVGHSYATILLIGLIIMDHSKHSRAMLVSFSGIDGAGKSTQIESLRENLHDAGLRVRLITFWDDVARLKGIREGVGHKVFKGDKGVGTPEAPIERRDKNVHSPLMTVFRMGLYLIDAISLRIIAMNAIKSDADVVIFDRYIYDEAANLDLKSITARTYLRGIMKLVPKPEVGFVLDADPDQARARKPEYPLEFLRSNRNSYLQLSDFLGGITVIPPMPLEEVKAEVARQVLQRTFGRPRRIDEASNPLGREVWTTKTRSNG